MKEHLRQLVRGREPLQGRNLVREYLQARILGAFQRAGAMTALAFQGGTCLRFLFNLPRYSEDLDFALEGQAPGYKLRGYLQAVQTELSAENYQVELRVKEHRVVHSAFVRFPGVLYETGLSPYPSESLAVKVEVDTLPPAGAVTGISLLRRHEMLRLFHHDRASLLAGKLHAILKRPYTKGRDIYDLIWYLSDPDWPLPNLALLNSALRQTDRDSEELTSGTWRQAVATRLDALDWQAAVTDVQPFLERQDDLDLIDRNEVMRLLRTKRGR